MNEHVHNFRFDGDDLFVCKPCPDETAENLSAYDFGEIRTILNEHAALKQALTLIGDIGYDYDGYGTPNDLKKLIDEMVGYARNPQSAVDVLTAEEEDDE